MDRLVSLDEFLLEMSKKRPRHLRYDLCVAFVMFNVIPETM